MKEPEFFVITSSHRNLCTIVECDFFAGVACNTVSRYNERFVYTYEFFCRKKFLQTLHADLRHNALAFCQVNTDIIIHRLNIENIL